MLDACRRGGILKRSTPKEAADQFAQWASLFSGNLFVKIAAYLDESGRHDRTGRQKGSAQIVVAGWLDWRENWTVFCKEWEAVLADFGAPYFHFSEWADASAVVRNKHRPPSDFAKNPYGGWGLSKLDRFLYALADIAGSGKKVILGGFISSRDFDEARKHSAYRRLTPTHGDPYRECLLRFFDRFSADVSAEWPYWSDSVTLFFDQNDDPTWNHAVYDAFILAKKRDPRIAELAFVDKKIMPHLPLQAADMLAYRIHQHAGKFVDPSTAPVVSELDKRMLMQPMLRSMLADPGGTLRDYFSLLPLRIGKFPWRKGGA